MSMKDLKVLVEKIDTKVDKLDERLDSIDVTLVRQNKELELHIYRTDLAEQRIELLQSDIAPLSKLHSQMNGAFMLIGKVISAVGALGVIVKLAEYFF